MALNKGESEVKHVKLYVVGKIEGREEWYLDEETADVHFCSKTTGPLSKSVIRIPAHRTILAWSSDVFKRMFYGNLKETADVQIVDATASAFKEFLQIFYLPKIDISMENFAEVFHLADKYNIKNYIDICMRFFIDKHNVENIISGLQIGKLYDCTRLVDFCERYIVRNTNAVLKSDKFLKCSHEMLTHMLNADLFVCPVVQLFESIMNWVQVKSETSFEELTKDIVDKHLGELFYNIRF